MTVSEQIKAIINENELDMSIGRIETILGLSIGYFSRFNTWDKIKLSIGLKLEEILKMDIHEIINYKPKFTVVVEMTQEEYDNYMMYKNR